MLKNGQLKENCFMFEILEFFMQLLGITFIFYVLFAWIQAANLYRIAGGIMCLLALIISGVSVCRFIFISLPINSTTSYFFISTCIMALILLIWLFKAPITATIRIISCYIHKEKVFAHGYKELGSIIDIKREYFSSRRHPYRTIYICHLIVDCNGEKIKSMYFFDDKHPKSYSIGENIDIMVYDKYKYVILNENTN
jgi:hypothetical protein